MRFRSAFPLAALALLAATPVAAQKRQPTPEQRIDRLEKQVRQVQKQVFPKGQPADTAGFSDDPAATQDAVNSLSNRVDALERQMADLVRQSEENGNRVATLEAELARVRADSDQRLRTLESGAGAGPGSADTGDQNVQADPVPPPSRPKVETSQADVPPPPSPILDENAAAEAAYDKGYQLWNAGKYDQAITALKAMTKAYPNHRRVSWARNLEGRALLDKGQPRAAAEALLANYRNDPKGERAQDSLFYLGQSLMKLGQPGQACKAYQELEEVYGASVRPQLKSSLPAAKAAAKCS
jgi:TolA-binding protein